MMTKKDFIHLADHISVAEMGGCEGFSNHQISYLAKFCKQNNPAFKTDRWINYIMGNCGPNGGEIKKKD